MLAVAASLARDGQRAVVATLHSPSSRAFRLCVDKLVCLGTGGKMLWCAPTGVGASGPLGAHLAACGYPYTEGDALADLMMYTFGGGTGADGENPRERSIKFAERWAACEAAKREAARVAAAVAQARDNAEGDDEAAGRLLNEAAKGSLAWHGGDARRHRVVATSPFYGIAILWRYRSLRNFLDADYIGARLGDKILYGFVLATLFWGEASRARSEKNVSNTVGLLWFIVVLPGYAASAYIPQLVMEKPIIIKECTDGCYSPWTYLASKMIEEYVALMPFSLAFVGALYGAIALQGSFWVLWLVNYVTSCVGVAIAYWVAASSPNIEAANAILPTYVTVNILFTGYLIILGDMPQAWRWYAYTNFMYYGFVAVMRNNFHGNLHPFAESTNVLAYYDIKRGPNIWQCLVILIGFLFFFIFLAGRALGKLVATK